MLLMARAPRCGEPPPPRRPPLPPPRRAPLPLISVPAPLPTWRAPSPPPPRLPLPPPQQQRFVLTGGGSGVGKAAYSGSEAVFVRLNEKGTTE